MILIPYQTNGIQTSEVCILHNLGTYTHSRDSTTQEESVPTCSGNSSRNAPGSHLCPTSGLIPFIGVLRYKRSSSLLVRAVLRGMPPFVSPHDDSPTRGKRESAASTAPMKLPPLQPPRLRLPHPLWAHAIDPSSIAILKTLPRISIHGALSE